MKLSIIVVFLLCLFFMADGAQLPITINIPNTTYAPGTYPNGPFTVPAGAKSMKLLLNRLDMNDPASTIEFQLDLSPDGGKNYQTRWCGFKTGAQANLVDVKGKAIPDSFYVCRCELKRGCDPQNSLNTVIGRVIVANKTGSKVKFSGYLEIQ